MPGKQRIALSFSKSLHSFIKGMRDALIADVLYSRALKLPLLPLMVHYFGLAYTLVLSFYLLLFAVISGSILERLIARR